MNVFCFTLVVLYVGLAAGSESVNLRILEPVGLVTLQQDAPRSVAVRIAVDLDVGAAADSIREDASQWRICYRAFATQQPSDSEANFLCLDFIEGSIPDVDIPQRPSARPGRDAHWTLAAYLEHKPTGVRVGEIAAPWLLRENITNSATSNVYQNPSVDAPRSLPRRFTYNDSSIDRYDPRRRTHEAYLQISNDMSMHHFSFSGIGDKEDPAFHDALQDWCNRIVAWPDTAVDACMDNLQEEAAAPKFEWAGTCERALSPRGKLGHWLRVQGYSRGVEVGVFRGENAKKLLDSWVGSAPEGSSTKDSRLLYLVDAWASSEECAKYQKDTFGAFGVEGWQTWSAAEADDMRRDARANVGGYHEHTTWKEMRQFSLEAAEAFPDGSLDFVYIDAAHDHASVAADVAAWWPKLRTGGLLAGDDYNLREELAEGEVNEEVFSDSIDSPLLFGVKRAVDDFARSIGREVGYALGDWEYHWVQADDPLYGRVSCNWGILK